MGIVNEFDWITGNPLNLYSDNKKILKDVKWHNKCVVMLPNGSFSLVGYYDDYGHIITKNNKYNILGIYDSVPKDKYIPLLTYTAKLIKSHPLYKKKFI